MACNPISCDNKDRFHIDYLIPQLFGVDDDGNICIAEAVIDDINAPVLEAIEECCDIVTNILTGATAPTNAVRREAGKTQIVNKAITAASDAGSTVALTVTAATGRAVIESIILGGGTTSIHANLTSAAVKGGASEVLEFLSSAVATAANLNGTDEQVSWTGDNGAAILGNGKTITITFAGTGAGQSTIEITVIYKGTSDGVYLS